jgi:hypothetical protein
LRTDCPNGFFERLICFLDGNPLPLAVFSPLRAKLVEILHGLSANRLVRLFVKLDHAEENLLILAERMTEHRLINAALVRLDFVHVSGDRFHTKILLQARETGQQNA